VGGSLSRYFPVSLDLEGRPCVVLGGGSLAAEKAHGLLAAGALVTVYAAEAEPELRHAAADGRLELVPRDYRPGDLAGAWLAIDASGRDETNAAARREADERRVLLNAVDRAHLETELGQVVAGTRPGRTDPDQVTLFKSVGNAVQDIAVARFAVERAEALGRGQHVEL